MRPMTGPALKEVQRQLERVRRRARGLLLVQRLCQWTAAVLLIALGLGLVDYALRLPDSARAVIGPVVGSESERRQRATSG